MEAKPKPTEEKKEEAPKTEASTSNTVVNVVPPPAENPVKDQPPAIPPPLTQPAPEVPVKHDPAEKQAPSPLSQKQSKPVVPKQDGNGVTAAIIATVVIVLGLAALAVYAYIKTK